LEALCDFRGDEPTGAVRDCKNCLWFEIVASDLRHKFSGSGFFPDIKPPSIPFAEAGGEQAMVTDIKRAVFHTGKVGPVARKYGFHKLQPFEDIRRASDK